MEEAIGERKRGMGGTQLTRRGEGGGLLLLDFIFKNVCIWLQVVLSERDVLGTGRTSEHSSEE